MAGRTPRQKEAREERLAQGLCAIAGCPNPRDGTKTKCVEHLAYDRSGRHRVELERIANDLCPDCGEHAPKVNCRSCQACIDKRSAAGLVRYYANLEAGVCGYHGKKFLDETGTCTKCKYEPRIGKDGLTHYQRRLAQGLCYMCREPAKPVVPGMPYCEEHHGKVLQRNRDLQASYKQQVFDHYGWACNCCGLTIKEALQVDHVNGGGKQHRNTITKSLYKTIVDEGFPSDYQVLCALCNWLKHTNAVCIHQTLPIAALDLIRAHNKELDRLLKERL